MGRLSSPVMRNGFPFEIPTAEAWSTTSWHRVISPETYVPGLESAVVEYNVAGDIQYYFKPVVGQDTVFPFSVTFKELVLMYWRVREWKMEGTRTSLYQSPPDPDVSTSYPINDTIKFTDEFDKEEELVLGYGSETIFGPGLGGELASLFSRSGSADDYGNEPNVVRIGDDYYPRFWFANIFNKAGEDDPPDPAENTGGNYTYSTSGPPAMDIDVTCSVDYDSSLHKLTASYHSVTHIGGVITSTEDINFTLKANKYWSYGGLYNEDTGSYLG